MRGGTGRLGHAIPWVTAIAGPLAAVSLPAALGPQDDLWDISPRVAGHMRNGRFVRWPRHGICLFDVAVDDFFDLLDQHLTTSAGDDDD